MTELSREIFDTCHVRKTRKQKDRFIETVQRYYPEARVEEGGMLKSRNVIIGDIASAKAVFTAHYDTCAVMPVPNFLMPKNIFITLLYSFLLMVPVLALVFGVSFLMSFISDNFWVAYFTELAVLFGCLWMMMFGKANKATANDNTSGVVTLCEIMAALDENARNSAAFVFFDHEEAGLLGSAQFKKKYKNEMKDKLLVNFDCVSDGENILFILNKVAEKKYKEKLASAFENESTRNVMIEGAKGVYYPSDQAHFPVNAAVAAFKKGRLGLYIDRIHTKRDTVFDGENIECIVRGIKKFIEM